MKGAPCPSYPGQQKIHGGGAATDKEYRRAEIAGNILSAVRLYLRTRKDWELDFIRKQIEEYDALLEQEKVAAIT